MLNLPAETWIRFVVWMVLGVALYFFYGRRQEPVQHPGRPRGRRGRERRPEGLTAAHPAG